jgi:hypothetical protein
MKKTLLSLFLGLTSYVASAQTIFEQNFSSSTVATDYFATGGTNIETVTGNKFTAYTQGATPFTLSITNGTFLLNKGATAGAGVGIQLAGLSATGTDPISIGFDMIQSTDQGNVYQYQFLIGDDIGPVLSAPAASKLFAYIRTQTSGLNTNTWRFYNRGTNTNVSPTSAFSVDVSYPVFIVANPTAGNLNYIDPTGSTSTITTQGTDLWVGTTKYPITRGASNTGTLVKELVIMEYDGVANLSLDNIVIKKLPTTLPVSFSSLSAQLSGSNVNVNWATESEANNDRFEIEASTDGKIFKTIKTVQSKNGDSKAHQDYQATVSVSDIAGLLAIPALLALVGFAPMSRRRKFATLALVGFVAATSFVGCQKEGKDLLSQQDQGSEAILSGKKTIYIRIKQVDKDGTATYSNVVVAK